jgi:hypothetical protein
MGIFRGAHTNSVQANLILDAASQRSYPGSGTTWYDLSGNGHNADIFGSPTHGELGGAKCFILDAVGKRFNANTDNNNSSNDVTLEAWIYPSETELTSGDRGCIIQGSIYLSWVKSSRALSNYWYQATPNGYHNTSTTMDRERWHHIMSVWNSSDGNLYQYINGVLVGTVSTVATSGSYYTDLNIGWEGDSRQFSGGISVIKVYNNTVSGDQVLQNYNAQKSRFGL